MRRLFKFFKPDIGLAIIGVLFVIIAAVLDLYQIQLMAQIIDVGINNLDFSAITSIGIKMIALALVGTLIAMIALVFPSQVSNNFAERLREAVYLKVQKFSLKNFNRFYTATLVTRLTNDVSFLQRTLMMCMRMLVRAPVLIITTFYMTYRISPSLSWVMLVSLTLLGIVLGYIVILGFPRFVWLQTRVDKLNHKIQESLINIRVIKSFVRESYEDERFIEENKDLYDASVRANILMAIMNPSMMAAVNFTTIVVVWVSAYLIAEAGLFDVGSLLAFITYLRFIMFAMMMLTNVLMMLSRSKASMNRINEVLDEKLFIENPDNAVHLEKKVQDIVFDHVSFRYYDGAEDVLKDINLTIKAGEHIGIIGSTGSGKSTLINLLGRLLDPSEGKIYYGDTMIREADLQSLRSEFGFVPQKNLLFSGTIASNLRLGNPRASIEDLKTATKVANIYDFIAAQPKSFESPVQQGGSNFSGGQKQRLCIARALAMHPAVLILDDSTSALDAATEAKVKEALQSAYSGMTMISVAQKISSIADADRIVVLDKGEIIGLGSHEELMSHNAVYQEIYDSQMRKGVLEA